MTPERKKMGPAATPPATPEPSKPQATAAKEAVAPPAIKSLYSPEVLTNDHTNINYHDFIAIVPPIFYDLALLLFMVHGINTAPYTKVEESFNTQAIHDLMMYKANEFSSYDHLAFPGVVPRTFIGPMIMKLVTQPMVSIMTSDGNKNLDLDWYLYIARYVFAFIAVHSLRILRQGVTRAFGYTVASFFSLICFTQFHLVFWGSRFIPNTWAMIFVSYAFGALFASWNPVSTKETLDVLRERQRIFGSPPTSLNDGKVRKLKVSRKTPEEVPIPFSLVVALGSLTFASIVFRLELLALFVPLFLSEVFIFKHIKVVPAFVTVAIFSLISLSATVLTDTLMWQSESLLWPELKVFSFNVLQGRSSEYGTSPPTYYLTHLLPKIAPLAFPLALRAYVADPRVQRFMNPALIFIATLSLVGHKEWRFLFPILPLVNVAAAITLTRVHRLGWMTKASQPAHTTGSPQFYHKPLALLIPVALAVSFVAANASLEVSSLNYPGGVALRAVHDYVKMSDIEDGWPVVHMDVYTCQNGASRFLEMGRKDGWTYRKDEGLSRDDEFVKAGFSHLLTTTPELHVGAGWNELGVDGKPVGPAKGSKWEVVPGYIHALKDVKIDFGPGGAMAWAQQTAEKVMQDGIEWRPKRHVYGVKLPIEVRKEPKIYLLQKKGWKS
ncbi:Alg9-like mannosyltransferase family-domain-containing protein [Chytriomyces cf. hyalinus JEL632]|nr:Alg9-like mannosyltransferase family-domain-containing protein [Chytriomyces cf. hyalinus JEL632]